MLPITSCGGNMVFVLDLNILLVWNLHIDPLLLPFDFYPLATRCCTLLLTVKNSGGIAVNNCSESLHFFDHLLPVYHGVWISCTFVNLFWPFWGYKCKVPWSPSLFRASPACCDPVTESWTSLGSCPFFFFYSIFLQNTWEARGAN